MRVIFYILSFMIGWVYADTENPLVLLAAIPVMAALWAQED